MTQTTTFILWGFKGQGPAVYAQPIALTAGSVQHCNAEKRMRKDEGWTFAIYGEGTAPDGLIAQSLAVRRGTWR